MAGIGFELKKAFRKQGLFALLRAYGYAGIVCAGPMILGMVLLLGVRIVGKLAGAGEAEMSSLNTAVTYTLIFSMIAINALSMVTTRYTADMLYTGKEDRVLPSLHGSICLICAIACPIWGLFLLNSGMAADLAVLSFIFFGEMIIVWTQINYLTAIKDYRGVLIAFAVSVTVSLLLCYVLTVWLKWLNTAFALMLCVTLGYGILAIWYEKLLLDYFPKGNCSMLYFLEWADRYPELAPLGMCLAVGLFGHLVIMWFSPEHVHVAGLLWETPIYDIPAFIAFFSILITTINFVTSVEVEFYPTYRNFFALLNDEGSLADVEQAKQTMQETLIREMTYAFVKQFFSTMIFIIGGTLILPMLPLGFSEDMLGIFRVLCCAYAFYAMGNCMMLLQLYFADNRGALISAGLFAAVTVAGTIISLFLDVKWYGVGFLLGGAVFAAATLIQLREYLSKILEHILTRQPLKPQEVTGLCCKIGREAEKRYREKHPELELEEEEARF